MSLMSDIRKHAKRRDAQLRITYEPSLRPPWHATFFSERQSCSVNGRNYSTVLKALAKALQLRSR